MFQFFKNRKSTEENDVLLEEMKKLNASILSLLAQNEQFNRDNVGENDGLLQAMKDLNKNILYVYRQNGKLLQEMKTLNASVLSLLAQNEQLWKSQRSTQEKNGADGAGESGRATEKKEEYTPYKKGNMSKPRDFFDSPPERALEGYLDNICSRYDLGRNFSIRILAHQPLGNYTKETKIIQVNRRNKEMHFDFLIEIRKRKKGFSDTAGHFPVLAIELNGGTHDEPEQIERDEYKKGACEALKLPLIVIRYKEEYFTQEEIEKRYLADIMKNIFISMFRLALKNEDVKQYGSLLEQERTNILNKYSPIDKFPGIDRYVEEAYNDICEEVLK